MAGSGCLGSIRRELPGLTAVFLYFVGESMSLFSALPLVSYGVCRDLWPNQTADFCLHTYQHPKEVYQLQKSSAVYLMVEKMLGVIPPLLLASFFGPWSDVHGRKLPFLVPFVGNVVAILLFLLAALLETAPVTLIVMAGFLARALTGHFILLHLVAFSHVTDVIRFSGTYTEIGASSGQRRGRRKRGGGRKGALDAETESYCSEDIGSGGRGVAVEVAGEGEAGDQGEYLGAMSRLQVSESLGIVLGALLGWALQKAAGVTLSFAVAAAILLMGMVVIVVFVRDYRPPCADLQSSGSHHSYLVTCFRRLTKGLRCKRLDVDPGVMWGCLLVMFLLFAVREGRGAITTIYLQLPPLSFPNERLAAFIAVYSAFQSVFLFVVAPFLKDRNVVLVGVVFNLAGGLWLGLASTTWGMMLAGSFSHMVDVVFPALRAILASNLGAHQVGDLLSKMSAAEALATIVGPLSMTLLYNSTLDFYPGLAFIASAAVPAAVLLFGAVAETFYQPRVPAQAHRSFEVPDLGARDATHRPDFTQSLNVPSATASGYGLFWCSSQW